MSTLTWDLPGIGRKPDRRKGAQSSARLGKGPDGQTPNRHKTPPSARPADPVAPAAAAASQQTAQMVITNQMVARCLAGDSEAWRELVSLHHRRVYGLCYRFTGSVSDAEDLTQDVFFKVYGNLRSFDLERGRFETWITTLTRNLLVDHFRRTRQHRLTGSIDEGWEECEDQTLAERLAQPGPDPHDQAVQKQLEGLVQSALVRVSPELREAVILRDLQGFDYKDIARVLGVPEGTVKSRIARGRAELARLLEHNKGQVV